VRFVTRLWSGATNKGWQEMNKIRNYCLEALFVVQKMLEDFCGVGYVLVAMVIQLLWLLIIGYVLFKALIFFLRLIDVL